jgi:UDP-N-acetylglucosamine 4-epimerase
VNEHGNELYVSVFARGYGFKAVGLRYFKVFGPKQNPNGAYTAVIPKWDTLLKDELVFINGGGETGRDFCFVANTVQANFLTAYPENEAKDRVYNVAVSDCATLSKLFAELRDALQSYGVSCDAQPSYRDSRAVDIRHSQADVGKAQQLLGFVPTHRIHDGIGLNTLRYFFSR